MIRWVFFIVMNDDTGGKKRSTFFTVYLSKEASCFFFVVQGVPFQIRLISDSNKWNVSYFNLLISFQTFSNIYRILSLKLNKYYCLVKFIYSEKATKFCEISTLLLTGTKYDKVRWKFRKMLWPSQNIWILWN